MKSPRLPLLSLITSMLLLAACGGATTGGSDGDSGALESPVGNLDKTSAEASYRITFTGQWTSTFGAVPGNAHFTEVIGSAVLADSNLWASGQPASAGMEPLAELGTTSRFASEIDAEVSLNRARGVFRLPDIFISPTESTSAELTLTRVYPLFTFATMVAPSPDWFVGLSEYSLLNSSGEWIDDVTVQLRVYDAGTKDGSRFVLGGTDTSPRGVIQRLNDTVASSTIFSGGLVNGQAIASVRFQRVR